MFGRMGSVDDQEGPTGLFVDWDGDVQRFLFLFVFVFTNHIKILYIHIYICGGEYYRSCGSLQISYLYLLLNIRRQINCCLLD